MMQSLLPALYPMLRSSYQLSFTQIGLLTFTFQSPRRSCSRWWGIRRQGPAPIHSPPAWVSRWWGWCCSPFADSYALLLFAAALIGTGSSVFHPNPHACAHGLRRQARPGAIGVPGWR